MRMWTTADQAAAERYSYWREVICQAFTALEPVTRSKAEFQGTVLQRDYAEVTVSEVTSKAQTILRRPREISRNPIPRFFANLQLSGTGVMRQDGRETLLRPGDLYITDITRPYELEMEDWRIICCRIPHHMLAPLLPDPRRPAVICIDPTTSAMASVAAAYMKTLNQAPDPSDLQRPALFASSLVNLIALAVGENRMEDLQHRAPRTRQTLLSAILRHVGAHIADPRLSAAQVAAAFHISSRYLHRLFEEHDQPFGQTVLKLRLENCARDLAASEADRTITEIAYRWGFGDLSHFCHVFRSAYGMSARAFRYLHEPPPQRRH
jgi:AraC family transcriptional activator of tynA and feaB